MAARRAAVNQTRCEVAYFHKPLFSSGFHGDQRQMRRCGARCTSSASTSCSPATITTTSASHLRILTGRFDPTRGIRQFVVGTGGTTLRTVGASRPNSEVHGTSWGVLVLTLEDSGYRWEFVPAEPGGFQDAGVGQCH